MSTKTPLHIGSRWSTGHAIIRDPVTGAYEERNPPMGTEAERVQAALLNRRASSRWVDRVCLAIALVMLGWMAWVGLSLPRPW